MSISSTRLKWIAERVATSLLENEDSTPIVEDSMRDSENQKALNEFLSDSQPSKPLLVFPRKNFDSSKGPTNPARLTFTVGSHPDNAGAKGVYFVRLSGDENSKPDNDNILFGEIGPDSMSSLYGCISNVFMPSLENADWGCCDQPDRAEFIKNTQKFASELKSVMQASGHDQIHLELPNELVTSLQDPNNPEGTKLLSKTLQAWIDRIDRIVSAPNHQTPNTATTIDGLGPRVELEYWRNRMHTLDSLKVQMKNSSILIETLESKASLDPTLLSLHRRWKLVDVGVSEAQNEAHDNVKYLTSLDRYLEPIYSETPLEIIDSIPSLINSLKMMNSISRYFSGSAERMTSLLTKITNQMIINCKQYIVCVGGGWWGGRRGTSEIPSRSDLIARLTLCISLNENFQSSFRRSISEQKDDYILSSLNLISIFGKFDLFTRRLSKLVDLFKIVARFDELAACKFDGLEKVLDQFNTVCEEFKLKNHEYLDYHNNKFDRDYVEFAGRVGTINSEIATFANQRLEEISTNIESSLTLVERLKFVFGEQDRRKFLDDKYLLILANYGTYELLKIQDLYEKYKSNPPLGRDMPPVAGNISWSRHLLRRIEEPMKIFQDKKILELASNSGTVAQAKNSRNIVKLYNRLARTLIEFETVWYQAWVNSIDEAKSGLRVNVIIRHPDDNQLYVNMDPELMQLIREAKVLDRMGIEIPNSARMVLLQEERHKKHFAQLKKLLRDFQNVIDVPVIFAKLLAPHIAELESAMKPAMNTLTWTSLNLDGFIQSFGKEISRFDDLVKTIKDYVKNRIEHHLTLISNTILFDVFAHGTSFLDEQEKYIEKKILVLTNKSVEIENAVSDLLRLILNHGMGESSNRSVDASELVKVKAHYNWAVYNSLLTSVKKSLTVLRRRVVSSSLKRPLFEIGIELDGNGNPVPNPSFAKIGKYVAEVASLILSSTKMIDAWDNTAVPGRVAAPAPTQPATSSPGTFYDRLVQDKDILKSLLVLNGCLCPLGERLTHFFTRFEKYKWLWDNVASIGRKTTVTVTAPIDQEASLRAMAKRISGKLDELVSIKNELGSMEFSTVIGSISITSVSILADLVSFIDRRMNDLSGELHRRAKFSLEQTTEKMKQLIKKLNRTVDDIESLGFVMNTLAEIRLLESGDMEKLEIEPIQIAFSILDSVPGNMDKDEQDMRSMLWSNWKQVIEISRKRQSELSKRQGIFKTDLINTINVFTAEVEEFRNSFETRGPTVVGIEPTEAVERLRRFKDEFEIQNRKRATYKLGEKLFGLDHQLYPQLDKTEQELGYLSTLYDLYVVVIDTIKGWKEMTWSVVVGERGSSNQIDSMRDQIESFSNRCKKMPKQLKEWRAFGEMKKAIDDFTEVVPILVELAKPSMQSRHWDKVFELIWTPAVRDTKISGMDDQLKLGSLIESDNLIKFKDEILDITDSADKQLLIEKKIGEIDTTWKNCMLDFIVWKNRDRCSILSGGRVGEIQEQLEESMMALSTMISMRHSVPFRPQLSALITVLSDTIDTLEKWIKVQILWTSLESVFTTGDIAKQMPLESRKFGNLDKEWIRVMGKCSEIRIVVGCCQNETLKQLLPVLQSGLESCQKSLESYLEGKRNKFPRFYFVSDPVLLKILSQGGSDPSNVQEDLEKLFDSISRIVVDKADKRKILKIKSIVGNVEEVLELSNPVMATGNIEDWLTTLEGEMQKAVRRECKYAASQCGSVLGSLPLKDFVDRYIAQVALLGIQFIWTADFQDALSKVGKGDKSVMTVVNKKFTQILNELVSICLTDLGTRMNRTKYETLVTIHVHQRDLFTEIWRKVKEHRVKDETDFEWLKQTRFYWKSDSDHAMVSIAEVDFTYSYEYLGVKERLVITPLTDRCYLTLSQALGICYGGAPAGPAGTGKTETVKDLSRTLGIACVVTNCSDQHRSRDMASIFKGTCSAGIWSCFDEFNRIELEVLSVVAMQIEAITYAKKQHLKQFMFPGEKAPIRLNHSAGYFITMNPGYAGRQQLPNNLAILFRSVSMMVPDREIIMRVKLASVGYTQMDVLGKKFNILYQLCEQQLSKQRHYDFGLRNILSVLRTAGGVKRSEPPETDEEMIFMRTVRDMNLSKLVADDVPLFLALLRDIFPKQVDPPKKIYSDIEDGVAKYIKANNLVDVETWKLKVIQLYETSLVRHGLMLVGPTLCGKTEIINCLSSVLTDYCNNPHRVVTINPKAITDAQMYGVKDPISEEWTPGVFASIWQKYNNRSLKYTTWIVCDGPVDAIWIENLNSVLDDNKILTLANNDRITMTENCRILFEVENLNNASPATVSRAGIIYVSATDLGWTPLIESWLRKRPIGSLTTDHIRQMVDKLILSSDLMDWFMKTLASKCVMRITESMIAFKLLNLLDGLLMSVPNNPSMEYISRIIVYAIVWSFGGLLETEDRLIFNTKMEKLVVEHVGKNFLPKFSPNAPTLFEFGPGNSSNIGWVVLEPVEWIAPPRLNFSSLLIPTMDSVRAQNLMATIARCDRSRSSFKSSLLLGASGTAKTSTVQMYLGSSISSESTISKRTNFSSATTPYGFQKLVESEVERKTGKTFCPPNGKKMVLFIDDMSMPQINKWGDQVTLEFERQLIEFGGFYFLDKDKRGDFKSIENLEFVGAMVNPGGGRNDIPNRLKSKFFSFAMVMPNVNVVDSIYGKILLSHLNPQNGCVGSDFATIVPKLTRATIHVWESVKKSLLPTPQRFHYVFNMRDLSRVFQGILDAPIDIVKSGANVLVSLWRHECTRVFSDKLSRICDKEHVVKIITEIDKNSFPPSSVSHLTSWWADFQRDPPAAQDEDDEVPEAPKIYEPVVDIEIVRRRAYEYLQNYNVQFPAKKMNLVLFDDALEHLMKIVRMIQQKRGSGMLVGVGGSGKQSLARLASFICGHRTFQIAITKSYNENAFFDDMRNLFVSCGQKNLQMTFILTDAEIKYEEFLEHMNSFMSTGEIVGLFQKDEKESMCSDIRADFVRDRPGQEDSFQNLFAYFTDRVRDNLHVLYCFSPVSAKFAVRAQKFPAVFANSNIVWFLPWPKEALINVVATFLDKFEMATDSDTQRKALYETLGAAHSSVNDMCAKYTAVMRRHVYVTPKNFLCLIDLYEKLYREKLEEVISLERSVCIGLSKLNEAAADVERLKIDLKDEEIRLKVADEQTNELLVKVKIESEKAETQAAQVGLKKDSCLAKKSEIETEQALAERDLQAALPFLQEAENAVKSITAKDITELKTLKQPSDIIRLVFDGLLLLQQKKLCDVKLETKNINKQSFSFIHDSYDEVAKSLLTDIRFLPDLMEFSEKEKDFINDETCELLEPYLRLENFNPAIAKKASGACEGLCKWVGAMVQYHEAAKIVKPKMDYLRVQSAKLDSAMKELATAEEDLKIAMDQVASLNASFAEAMEKKTALEVSANLTRRKMDQAEKLINGLSSEKIRWTDDARNFANRKNRLIGDVALSAIFVTYCGAFNSEYREKLVSECFVPELERRGVLFTPKLNIVDFLVDQATIGEWALEGLPSDDLSIQNAIIITRSSRYPLIVDPQGQALCWIKNHESKRMNATQSITTLTNPRLKDQVEFTMGEGLCLLIENVEDEVDPLLDPVLDKALIKKGKNLFINVSDQNMDYNPKFTLYLTSRLPNPHFSPELSARCAVIDFTVTMKGLEQQLLGRVIGMEQKALEQSLNALMEDVNANTKALQELDKQLLLRLSNSTGNLLDDIELIEVLANTKATAKEVEKKIKDAEEKKIEINLKREQYRPVATRGSVLYFCITDMTMVTNPITLQPTGWMYNISLEQFMSQFDASISNSEKSQQTFKRVEKIIEFLTYQVYRYVNRGLFERDKLLFKSMMTLRILVVGGKINLSDVAIFLRAGSSLDMKAETPNPFPKWLSDRVWLNTIALSRHARIFESLPLDITKNEQIWKKWLDENEPEKCPIPSTIIESNLSVFLRSLLVRCLREDRTTIVCEQFVAAEMGPKFTQPVTDSIESIHSESNARTPIIYLLSAGSDPTTMIDEFAKKKRKFPTDKVSMGEGQEVIAIEKLKAGFLSGSWVVLQNSHLGLGFMSKLEDIFTKSNYDIHEDFRLWITCEVTNLFPIGLLQMSIKVTLEPPMGLRAGLSRTYATTVSQELLDKVDNETWRRLVYVMSFLHSVVQERRKFGAIGWCVPYEFNSSDMEASLLFLEKHLGTTVMVGQPLSWSTIQYMVSQVQYGGRITDDLDRELFNTYASQWLSDEVLKPGFSFLKEGPQKSLFTLPSEEGFDIALYKNNIDRLPQVDLPMVFGLHLNADLNYRQLEASMLLSTIADTQPKGGSAMTSSSSSSLSSIKTKDEIVKEKCEDILSRMPKDFSEEECRSIIAKHKGPSNTNDKGFQAPLNIFLFQEIQRMQRVLTIVRTNLTDLVLAIDGTVVMTPELLEDLNMISEAKIPKSWTHDASGAEISWLGSNLGTWFTGLIDRVAQLSNWLDNGRQSMKAYWLGGFLNPQGFLTAVRQEVTRQHKKDCWALDDVVTHTEVLSYDLDKVRDPPEEGQNIYGLFLEGARWNKLGQEGGKLDESEPKKLYTQMPVIRVTAVTAKERKAKGTDYGPYGPYDCPVYRYPKRTDKYLIFRMNLKTTENPNHWKLRGVGLLCTTE